MPRSAPRPKKSPAPLFAALGDETRLAIVAQLGERGPLSIVRLTEGTGITRQAVTKHLAALEATGILRSTKVGRERLWELEPNRLDEARQHLQQIAKQWDAAIGRLRALVED